MDVETTAAIEHLSDRIDRLETSVRAEFADVRAEMRSEFADVRAEMRDGFTSVRAEFRAELRDGFADMRTELRNGNEENRRYTDVLVEALRDDIRILAEGFATISVKIDSLQR